ncbi:MAG: hypothetical protein HKL86_07715 [Acidimicrobiaceae bacterium]|nr:hypothetical protein [Acidimicrobiaceae bacterium]
MSGTSTTHSTESSVPDTAPLDTETPTSEPDRLTVDMVKFEDGGFDIALAIGTKALE